MTNEQQLVCIILSLTLDVHCMVFLDQKTLYNITDSIDKCCMGECP